MNIFKNNTPVAPTIDFTPTWATELVRKAKNANSKTISLGDVPSGWYEHIAFRSKGLVYKGRFIEVTIEEFLQIVKEGKPC